MGLKRKKSSNLFTHKKAHFVHLNNSIFLDTYLHKNLEVLIEKSFYPRYFKPFRALNFYFLFNMSLKETLFLVNTHSGYLIFQSNGNKQENQFLDSKLFTNLNFSIYKVIIHIFKRKTFVQL